MTFHLALTTVKIAAYKYIKYSLTITGIENILSINIHDHNEFDVCNVEEDDNHSGIRNNYVYVFFKINVS